MRLKPVFSIGTSLAFNEPGLPMVERLMEKGNLKNKKGFLVFLLVLASSLPLRSAEAPIQSQSPNIISWSGIRMITLGTRYMTEVPALASEWVLKNKDGIIGSDSGNQAEEIKKIAKSVSDGMRNVGKILVLVGTAKEYKDYFEFTDNPQNPLNNKEKYTPEIIRAKQEARLRYLQTSLGFLQEKLVKQNIEADWLLKLFDSSAASTVSAKSLKFGLGQVGEVLELFNVYGIGIQISSDLPVGAMLTAVLSRWLPGSVEKYGSKLAYEDSVGILYYMQKKNEKEVDDFANDPLYAGLDPKHPIFELHRRENYKFAAKTYEQTGAQIEGVSYAHGSNKKSKLEANLTVRLTFLASTDVLKNFDVMNMNSAVVSELSARNNIMNALPGETRKVVSKAQDKIQQAYDKSKHFEFLSSNIEIAAAYVLGHVNEDTGRTADVPNMMLRLSMGNYALTAVKGRGAGDDLISVKGSLGYMTIDAN